MHCVVIGASTFVMCDMTLAGCCYNHVTSHNHVVTTMLLQYVRYIYDLARTDLHATSGVSVETKAKHRASALQRPPQAINFSARTEALSVR